MVRAAFTVNHEGLEILVEPLVHPGIVHLVGAGHVALATAHIAAFAGFEVVVLDDREEFANTARYPEARGAELMHRLSLAGLAEAVGSHREPPVELPARLGEKELVCLADKLAKCSSRMSVRERFEEKLALYAGDEEACRVIRYRRTRPCPCSGRWRQRLPGRWKRSLPGDGAHDLHLSSPE